MFSLLTLAFGMMGSLLAFGPSAVLAAAVDRGVVAATKQAELEPFWLTYVELHTYNNVGERLQKGTQVLQTDPKDFYGCNSQTWETLVWPVLSDVSGGKVGTRFSPNHDIGAPNFYDPLDEVEVNTSVDFLGHQTFYADRNNQLYPLSGDADGSCSVDRSFTISSMECDLDDISFTITVSSLMYCTPL